MSDTIRGLLDFFGLSDQQPDYGDPYAAERAAQRAALQQQYQQMQQERYGVNPPRPNPDDPFYADRAHRRQELQYQDQERQMVPTGAPTRLDEILGGLTQQPEPTPKWLEDLLADRLWRKNLHPDSRDHSRDRTRRGFGW